MAGNIAASYRALGLRIGATPDEVKHAYRDLIKIWHPDRFPANPELRAQAHARTAELIAAYACVQEHLRHKKLSHLAPAHTRPPSPAPPPAYPVQKPKASPQAARAETPRPSKVRPDGSRRDYRNAKVIHCRHCGRSNLFAPNREVFRCRHCGRDPLQQPGPLPAPAPVPVAQRVHRMPLSPRVVAHYRTIAFVARATGILGMLAGVLLVGVTALAVGPEIEGRSFDGGTATGLFLLVSLVGVIAVVAALGKGNHPGLGTAMSLFMVSLLIGLVAAMGSLITQRYPGQGIAFGIAVALLVIGTVAMLLAGIALSVLLRADAYRDRGVAVTGLLLGAVELVAGAAGLMTCGP